VDTGCEPQQIKALRPSRLGGLFCDQKTTITRYEDASLAYVGINKHEGEGLGLYDTVLSATDLRAIFVNVAGRPTHAVVPES